MRKHYEYVAVLVSDDYTKQDINNILTVYYKSIENNFKPSKTCSFPFSICI